MTRRITKHDTWKHAEFVLTSGEVAEDGHLACIDTASGEVVPGQASTTLIPIGYFYVGPNSVTGDGTKKVNIRLFRELDLHWFANDSAPNNVTASDLGSEVYIKDSQTVSTLSTGRSKAGRAWAVSARYGVLIESGMAVTGPTGSGSVFGSVADLAALKAIGAASRSDGQVVLVRSDNSLWRFDSSETTTDASQQLLVAPDAGDGEWVRCDKSFVMKLPIAAATADAAALHTVPEGFALRLVGHPYWEVTADFTGGTASAIGVSTDVSGYDTKGDLLGGAAGDVEATLVAGITAGTLGGELNDEAGFHALLLEEGDVVRFDRITSAFTAGSGFYCMPVVVALAPATP